jgi:hypothetical protein
MGYTTEFEGSLNIDPPLTAKQQSMLNAFSTERHGGPLHVFEGYPGIWCDWYAPAPDVLAWNGTEKFYHYVDWLNYLINHFFIDWDVKLNGTIDWFGEDHRDRGTITVTNNKVEISRN